MKLSLKNIITVLVCSFTLPVFAQQAAASSTAIVDDTSKQLTNQPFEERKKQLTIERIYSSPSLHGQTPKSLKFSPDGSRVTHLQVKPMIYTVMTYGNTT